MIDNIDKILPFLNFETTDDFYYLQILQRKKENPQIGSNSRVIKNYYINSQEYLINHYNEIKQLCNNFNARASIRLNKRSYESVAFKTLENIANSMRNHEYKFIKNCYDRACGLCHNDSEKKWIVDIDEQNLDLVRNTILDIRMCEPNKGHNKHIEIIPSKNGFHLITKPFNVQQFNEKNSKIEIHKDNPTNLYIP